jgi:flagellar protein FlaG
MSNDRMTIGAPAAPLPANPVVPKNRPAAAAAAVPAPAQQAAAPKPAADTIKAVAQQLESYLKSVSRALEFRVDATSGRTVVSVVDAETGDLIRQIPGEEVLRLAEMAEDQTIVLLKESA